MQHTCACQISYEKNEKEEDAQCWDGRGPGGPSLETLSSSPLTFFFGMAFKATSRVTSCDTESAEPAWLGVRDSCLGEGEAAGGVEGEPVWRRWTCHVARWMTESVKVTSDMLVGW
jgi:hypothetical protein